MRWRLLGAKYRADSEKHGDWGKSQQAAAVGRALRLRLDPLFSGQEELGSKPLQAAE